MAKSNPNEFYRMLPFGNLAPRRRVELRTQQIAPVLHHANRWRGSVDGADRIIFDHMFWLMLEGEMTLKMSGETHHVGPYELIWVPPFVPHHELGGPNPRAFVGVHFDLGYGIPDDGAKMWERDPYEVIYPPEFRLPRVCKLSPAHPVVTLAESLPLVMKPPTGSLAIECNNTLHAILTHLLRSNTGTEGSRAKQAKQNALIARAVLFAHEHFRKELDLSVDDLADVAGLSRSRFEYLFRVETGLSPMVFIRKLRIDYAKTLLADIERPIKVIAVESGHRDFFQFSRVFKSVVGCSPTEFRERLMSSR